MTWRSKIWRWSNLAMLVGVGMMVAGPLIECLPLSDLGFIVMFGGWMSSG